MDDDCTSYDITVKPSFIPSTFTQSVDHDNQPSSISCHYTSKVVDVLLN